MNIDIIFPSELAPRSVLGIPAFMPFGCKAGIQRSPKSAYFWWWFNDYWIPDDLPCGCKSGMTMWS